MVLAPAPLAAPLDRPFGSTQVLRYRGSVATSVANANVYPKSNMVIPANSALINANAQFEAWVRFALFDPNFPTTSVTKTFPPYIYDNSQPAGAAPLAPVSISTASTNPGVNTTDQIANFKTWAQNIDVHENRIDSNVLIADVGLAQTTSAAASGSFAGPGMFIMLDATNSGLGTGTNLYVACIRFIVNSTGGGAPAIQAFNVDLTFEIRHTAIR